MYIFTICIYFLPKYLRTSAGEDFSKLKSVKNEKNSKTRFVLSSAVFNAFPYDFAIVHEQHIALGTLSEVVFRKIDFNDVN